MTPETLSTRVATASERKPTPHLESGDSHALPQRAMIMLIIEIVASSVSRDFMKKRRKDVNE